MDTEPKSSCCRYAIVSIKGLITKAGTAGHLEIKRILNQMNILASAIEKLHN